MHPPEEQVPATPARPAGQLHPLAEAVIAAVSEHFRQGNGGKPGAAEEARRCMLAQFAQIGLSPEWLARLRLVLP